MFKDQNLHQNQHEVGCAYDEMFQEFMPNMITFLKIIRETSWECEIYGLGAAREDELFDWHFILRKCSSLFQVFENEQKVRACRVCNWGEARRIVNYCVPRATSNVIIRFSKTNPTARLTGFKLNETVSALGEIWKVKGKKSISNLHGISQRKPQSMSLILL